MVQYIVKREGGRLQLKPLFLQGVIESIILISMSDLFLREKIYSACHLNQPSVTNYYFTDDL